AMVALVVDQVEIFLDLAARVDADQERERLQKELDEIREQVTRLEKLLSSPFAQKAPSKVVDDERAKLESYRVSAQKLRERLG
ncbi:MAG: hypothetical protein VB029_05155, partial [Anaerolineaceae bacterium]|nr:hypothetical protein [Anaerolineaceae bacterium]